LEVKGYLADLIAKESLGRIEIIGMRLGIDPKIIRHLRGPPNYPPISALALGLQAALDPNEGVNRDKAAIYILENSDNQDLLMETVFDIAKRTKLGGKDDTEIYTELNPIIERTMQCRINKKGDIIPIFDPILGITDKLTYIEKKLEEFGFTKTLTHYNSALKTYKVHYKSSISLLRSTFESLVDEILASIGEPLGSNQKEKIAQLEKLEIIKEIDTQECQKCHHKKRDSEFNYSYDMWSLLSHYGPHLGSVAEEEANFLFTSTLAFIWFLINRYENTGRTKVKNDYRQDHLSSKRYQRHCRSLASGFPAHGRVLLSHGVSVRRALEEVSW